MALKQSANAERSFLPLPEFLEDLDLFVDLKEMNGCG